MLIGDIRSSLAGAWKDVLGSQGQKWGPGQDGTRFKLNPPIVEPNSSLPVGKPMAASSISGSSSMVAARTTSFVPLKERTDLEAFAFDQLVLHFRRRSAGS